MGKSNKENKAPVDGAVLNPEAKPEAPKRARWNAASDAILVEELIAQKAQGKQTDNANWHSDAWTACAEKLVGSEAISGGAAKSAKACNTRWGTVFYFLILACFLC